MPLANSTHRAKPWAMLPSIGQGAGGSKGLPLAKRFARTGEDLTYYAERLMWVEARDHLGTRILDQIPGLA